MPKSQPSNQAKVEPVEVERLLLDEENPRLNIVGGSKKQDELVQVLWDEMAVDEVALSIAANGYFEEEPLFVIPREPLEKDPGRQKYTVVEGNRRLAAVRLLREPDLRRAVKATDLPRISNRDRLALDRLPVSIYPNKKALWEYFGFRHVNGPMEWDSLSKASYIASVRREFGVALEEIAHRIGDRHSTVIRIYRGYILLEQAERMTDFKREDRIANRFFFSHLYTAVDQREYQEFLGIGPSDSLKDNPVPKSHLPQLQELMLYLFGSKAGNKPPIVQQQNPHLNQLRRVLGNKQALFALRSGLGHQRAYEISLGDSRRFQEALMKAKTALQEAKGTVTSGYKGDREMFAVMEDIAGLASTIYEEMKKKAKG